jgi:serine/threonine-protein kinase ULK4
MFGVDLMAGLQYLHSKGVLYGDLKPSNVLVDEFGVLKLSDFARARKVGSRSAAAPSPASPSPTSDPSSLQGRGTPAYMAPELFLGGVPSFASELWSFGCVLYEMYFGEPPFTYPSLNKLMHAILNADPSYRSTSKPGDENSDS